MNLQFNADPWLQVFLDPTSPGAPDQAVASFTATATIVNSAGATVFSFTPDGSGFGTGGVVGGMATLDPYNLNQTRTSNLPFQLGNSIFNPCPLVPPPAAFGENPACAGPNLFSVTSNPLGQGTYELRLSVTASTNVQRQGVPEPESLALLGIGLAAFGLTRKRKGELAAN